jgi:hypothetical protein
MKLASTLLWILILGLISAPVVSAAGAVEADGGARIAFYVA